MVPQCAVAEIHLDRILASHNSHPTSQAAPDSSRQEHHHITTKRLCPQARRPMTGTTGFPENCTVLCSESALLFKVWGVRLMSRYGTIIRALHLAASNIEGHHDI